MLGSLIGAGASLLGGLMGGSKKDKDPQQAAQQAAQSSWSDINRVNALNRENALWAQLQNQAAQDRALAQNRVNYSSPFGSTTWTKKPSSAPAPTAPKLDLSGLTAAINELRNGGSGGAPAMSMKERFLSPEGQAELRRYLDSGTFSSLYGEGYDGGINPNSGRARNMGGQQVNIDTSGIANALEALVGQFSGMQGAQAAPADEWTMEQSLPPELQAALDQMRGKYQEQIGGIQANYTPRDEQERALVEQIKGKYGGLVGSLEGGFHVDNDVMQALRAQLQPGLDATRNRENARLAAMGLGTGSGSAWGLSQDALNRSANDANQKAVIGGFDAWRQAQENARNNLGSLFNIEQGYYNDWLGGQANIRNNLGTMAGLESTWRQNMQMPSGIPMTSAAMIEQPTVGQPENRTWEAAQMANNQNAVNQAGNASRWNGIGKAAGSAWDYYSNRGSAGSGGYDPWAGGGGYSGGGIWE